MFGQFLGIREQILRQRFVLGLGFAAPAGSRDRADRDDAFT
jgi:hypothetical protein